MPSIYCQERDSVKTLIISAKGDIWGFSGTSSTLHELLSYFASKGEVLVLSPIMKNHESQNARSNGSASIVSRTYTFRRLVGPGPVDLSPSFVLSLRHVLSTEKPDLVLTYFLSGVIATTILVPGTSKLVYLANVLEHDYRRKLRKEGSGLQFIRFSDFLERLALSKCDHVLSVSEGEKSQISSIYDVSPQKVTVVQPGKRDFFQRPSCDKEVVRSILDLPLKTPLGLFHGGMRHPANRAAVDRIRYNIAPKVRSIMPSMRFILAGYGMPVFVEGNVISVGFVDDLAALIDSIDVAVMPITVGSGVRIKMIDYMSRGVPVVVTSESLEGTECRNGVEVIVAETDEEFASTIVGLLTDRDKANHIGQNGRKYANEHFSPEVFEGSMGKMVRSLFPEEPPVI
jgi:glycosyltransferase involved in cell wall biosynthesis